MATSSKRGAYSSQNNKIWFTIFIPLSKIVLTTLSKSEYNNDFGSLKDTLVGIFVFWSLV